MAITPGRRSRLRAFATPLLVLCTAAVPLLVGVGSAEAATTATIRVASGSLRVRAAATTQSAVAGTLRNRATVSIACQVTGQYAPRPPVNRASSQRCTSPVPCAARRNGTGSRTAGTSRTRTSTPARPSRRARHHHRHPPRPRPARSAP